MIDLESFNESLKIKWIKGYLGGNNEGKWKSFVNHYLEKHDGKLVFSANLQRQDTPLLKISNPFLAETVEYWSTLKYSEDNLNFPFSQIWLNSLIRIDTKPFFYKSWFHAGVKYVKDLLDVSNYNFLNYTAFITKCNIKTNYLEYYIVVSALKHFRKNCSNNQNFTTLLKATDNLFSSEKVCKTFYQILLQRKTSSPVKSQGKWLTEDLFSNVQVNWENTYQLPFLCTTETKLRVFQFKFLHRRVATNDFLLKIGKKETDSCSFCDCSPETRIFFGTQTFWNNVSQWTSEELDLTILNITPFSPALCLGLIDNISNLLLHQFLLIARHYIYSCKLRNTIPMVQVYTQLVIRSTEIEKQIAFDNNNLASFRKK